MLSKLILYYTTRSPPCRAVQLTAAAIGLKLELRNMNLIKGDHLTPEFLKLNPQLTIPVLDDGGVGVVDSHVICGYLADKYSKDDTLYPRDPVKRREVDARLFYDCGHMFPRVRFIVEPVIHFGFKEIPADRIDYMARSYDGLERCLVSNNGQYLCGSNMTIADLCSIATISSAMMFAPINAEKLPNLTDWVKRMSQLPYYEKYNKEGADVLYNFVQERLAENKKK